MKILNAYSGVGGNRTLWGDKHDITAIEIDQKIACYYLKRFPEDKVLIGDAKEYIRNNYHEFNFIWVSVPCHTHSLCNNFLHAQGVRRYADMSLWQIIIYLEKYCQYNGNNIYWVVENVHPNYELLKKPNFIIGRHYFWSNIWIPSNKYEFSTISVCNAKTKTKRTNREYLKELEEYLEIRLPDSIKIQEKINLLKNCVHPRIGKKILNQVLKNNNKSILSYVEV